MNNFRRPIIFILASFLWFYGFTQTIQPADSLANEAAKQFVNKKYENSLKLAQQALQLDKTKLKAWVYVARSKYFLDDFEGTIKDAGEGLKLFPNSDTLNNVIGASYRELFQYEKAIPYFEKALKINKKYSHPYYNLEYVYLDKRNYQKLIPAYTSHIKAFPEEPQTIYDRAELYMYIHDYDNAIKDYSAYHIMVPNETFTYFKIAECNFFKGNYPEAIANYNIFGGDPKKLYEYNWKDIIETIQKGSFIYPCIWGDCEYGYGVYVDKTGNIFVGSWINKIFYRGVVVYKNGSYYKGYFDSDYKKNGFGCEKTPDGKLKIGYFKDDLYLGAVPAKYELSKYKMFVVFKDDFDTPDKKWEIHDPDSVLKIKYENGKLCISNSSFKDGMMLFHHKDIENINYRWVLKIHFFKFFQIQT